MGASDKSLCGIVRARKQSFALPPSAVGNNQTYCMPTVGGSSWPGELAPDKREQILARGSKEWLIKIGSLSQVDRLVAHKRLSMARTEFHSCAHDEMQ